MTTRELIKNEIDQVQEHYLNLLHRIIRALMPNSSVSSTLQMTQEPTASWDEFLNDTYGVFRDEPLERSPQGTLEIREAFE